MKKLFLLLLLASSAMQPMENRKKKKKFSCWPCCSTKAASPKASQVQLSNSQAAEQKTQAEASLHNQNIKSYPHLRLHLQNVLANIKKDIASDQPKFNKAYSRAALKTLEISLTHADTLAQTKDIKPILDEAEPLAEYCVSGKAKEQDQQVQKLVKLMSSDALNSTLRSLDPEYAKAKDETEAFEKSGKYLSNPGKV
jgi:hypothetical protein